MDRLNEWLRLARRALATLEEVIGNENPDDITRDAAIQRFEYTFETTWKTAQAYLREREFVQAASPRAVIRESFKVGLLTEDAARRALAMAGDRNLTVHTYDENLAQQIYARLPEYASVCALWLQAIEERLL